jgi:hypothetical protein
LAGTIPLADPEHDPPWPVAALVTVALLPEPPEEPLPDPVLPDPVLAAAPLPAELPAGLAVDWLSAVLAAAVALACRAW